MPAAAAHAIPFLLELLASDAVPERERILCLLGEVAAARGGEARAAREAVRTGIDLHLRLLGDRDARIRAGAAHVLARLSDLAAGLEPRLRDALRAERDPLVRAGFLLCFGEWPRVEPETRAALEGALRNAGDERERAAAAVSLVRLGHGHPLPEALDLLERLPDDEAGDRRVTGRGRPRRIRPRSPTRARRRRARPPSRPAAG